MSPNPQKNALGCNDPVDTEASLQNEGRFLAYRMRQVASKTVVSFGPQDPEDPRNWPWVCHFRLPLPPFS